MKLEECPQYTVGSHMRRYISLNCPSTKSIASNTLDISEIQIFQVSCYGYGGDLSISNTDDGNFLGRNWEKQRVKDAPPR